MSSGRPELSTGTTKSSMLGRVSFSCRQEGVKMKEERGTKGVSLGIILHVSE